MRRRPAAPSHMRALTRPCSSTDFDFSHSRVRLQGKSFRSRGEPHCPDASWKKNWARNLIAILGSLNRDINAILNTQLTVSDIRQFFSLLVTSIYSYVFDVYDKRGGTSEGDFWRLFLVSPLYLPRRRSYSDTGLIVRHLHGSARLDTPRITR